MAKGNLFLGQARGKVGSVVFARAFGQQITRTLPTSVANPKTIGQNTQRAILATIAKSAAAMTSLVDHAFAGVTYGAESVRHFRKINMGLLRNLYLNTQNGANLSAKGGNFVPNPLKVSEGSLPAFISNVDDGDVGFLQDANKTLPTSGDISVERFLEAFPYLRGGDQITLVKITKVNEGDLLTGDALFTISLDRMVFTPAAFDDLNATIIAEDDGVIDTRFLDMTKTTDPIAVGLNPATGGLGFSSDGEVYYAALILSRKVNNVWQRSTQYLEQVEFNDHTDNVTAIASYGASASLNEATEYLNQADESTPDEGISGPYAYATVLVGDTTQFTGSLNAGSVHNESVLAAANTKVNLKIEGFGTSDARLLTCSVQKSDGTVLGSGAQKASHAFTMSAADAGVYWLTAVFANGTRSEFNITLQLQS